MRLLILTASLWALALVKPEMYKESEDFQYSRSSTDEGTKSGFYGAQRGNMGGNYEKAHNMDSMAQHHLSTLVRQVDGELGEGANTKTGSVFSAGNSRGIYGSGNYDLSNLKGRNFGESSGYDDSQSQSSLYQNARRGNSYYSNNAGYGNQQSLSSKENSGYSSSNHESQYSSSNLESENKYRSASNYDYGALGGNNARRYSFDNSQARGAYDQSNVNLHSTYDLNNQNRLTSATPVKIYIRPGERVSLPISVPSYTLYSSNLQDKKSDTNVLSNSDSEISYQPTNNAKHYESAYSYHKKWEKHDTQPLLVVPTENPFPANSELYENRQLDQTGQRYQSELDSSNNHLSNSAHQNYQSGISSADAQSSKTNSAYSRGYSANTKTASASQSRYQSESQNNAASSSSNTHSFDTENLGSSASNLNNLVEDINSRPKSYHSSFSYHKAWERRGDPYVITPSSDINGQTSQRLTATSQNQGQFSSQHYGSQYNQKRYSNVDCDALCYQRRKRSYNINQYEQYLNNGDINLGQQSEDGWDSDQQTENKFENLEDLGQATQNTWDNLDDNLGQQTQNNWGGNLFEVGQQTQNEWSNLGQQTENQKSQLENLDQSHSSNNKNLDGQQTQEKASELEDLGQQTQSQLGDLGQETQSEWDALGQQTQNQWGKLEDLGQQTQTNWGKQQEFGQTHTGDLEDKPQTQTADYNSITTHQQEKRIPSVNSDEPAKPKLSWDTINQIYEDQIYEEPPKTEKSDRNFKTGESLHDIEQLFEIEKLPKDKQSKDGQLPQSNKNEQTISTTINNKNQESSSTDSFMHSEPKDIPVQEKHESTPKIPLEPREWGNSGQENENPWSNLGQESETQWSNLGQESYNQFSNLGQENEKQPGILGHQNEPQWSNLGQESETQWGNLGQQSETQWSNLGQESDNQFSNLGQENEKQSSILSQQNEPQWSNLGQESETQWSNLGQQNEPQWSNLGQQSETPWSHLGQESETQWSNLGQQSETQWSNLGQESEKQSSILGQQNEPQWSNLGQESETQWFNLGQKSENQWSNLGQKGENQWSNLGQKGENQWSNWGQQGDNQWINLGQPTQNVWYSHVNQQNQFTGGEQQYLDQDKTTGFAEDKDKTETEITPYVEHQSLNEFLFNTYFQQVDNWSDHSHTNKQNQSETKDTENIRGDNKDLISGDNVLGGTHNVEHLSHDLDITSSKSPIVDPDTTNPKTSTELPRLPVLNKDTANSGRGDIGADDESDWFGGHIIDEEEKPNLIVYSLPSTTKKPINNEHSKPYTNILLDSTVSKIPVIVESIPEKSKTGTLPSQHFEEQNEDQQQFEQSLDEQQIQEGLSVLPANQDYKTVETEPLETIIQKHELPVGKRYWFAEQETKHQIENLESTTKKQIDIETPLETTTEKAGFWSSVWNKTKNAKNSVVSWFKN